LINGVSVNVSIEFRLVELDASGADFLMSLCGLLVCGLAAFVVGWTFVEGRSVVAMRAFF
jgi:hypothetical protein